MCVWGGGGTFLGAGTSAAAPGPWGRWVAPRCLGCLVWPHHPPYSAARSWSLPCSLPSHQGETNKTWLLMSETRPERVCSCLKHMKALFTLINIHGSTSKAEQSHKPPFYFSCGRPLWVVLGGEKGLLPRAGRGPGQGVGGREMGFWKSLQGAGRMNASGSSRPAAWQWAAKVAFSCEEENNLVLT